jgi:DNA uptake protein ComE-like DNA-binding protein
MPIITITAEAQQLLKDALKELEAPKGSVQAGVQKLLRAARMLGDEGSATWCEIQLGNAKYAGPLASAVKSHTLEYAMLDRQFREEIEKQAKKVSTSKKSKGKDDSAKQLSDWEKKVTAGEKHFSALTALGLKEAMHYPREERTIKESESGGGYKNIGTIEEILASLVRKKLGNDGTYYQNSLIEHINYVRRVALEKASSLYNKVAFASTPQTSLDILRAEVDSKLLDVAPEAAEKLMIAFRSVASEHPEEWSHALTSCRRFLEDISDVLYPPKDDQVKGRTLGKAQYINRLWAFIHESIESESNKELAKAHVDYLGSYLERAHRLGHKGVHADLSRTEAIKAVLHTYLLVADILDYLKKDATRASKRLNIHTASLDELESVLGISRTLAKEIVKRRVEYGVLDTARLATIKGISQRTVSLAEQLLSFEPIK